MATTINKFINNSISNLKSINNVSLSSLKKIIGLDYTTSLVWDITNTCSDLTGWTLIQNSNATVTQVTFDSKSTFRFYTNGETNSCGAGYKVIGSWDSNFTLEVDLYFDLLGSNSNVNDCRFIVSRDSTHTLMFTIGTDKVQVYNDTTAGWVTVATPTIIQDAWQTWRFVYENSGQTVNIYRYNWATTTWDTIATGCAANFNGADTAGNFRFDQYGYTITGTTYIDEIRIKNGNYYPI